MKRRAGAAADSDPVNMARRAAVSCKAKFNKEMGHIF
jgi:hypothetical protein